MTTELQRTVEALLFLSPEPVSTADLASACEVSEAEIDRALDALEGAIASDRGGVVLRRVAGGHTLAAAPVAEDAARRLLSKPRTPPLTQAQAEALGIIAYLQPVSRPEIARIRGVSSESAVATLTERGLIEESGRSRFGAVVYRTTPLFEKLFGLSGLDQLPDPSRFDPTPEDERDLRQRLLAAGEQRAS
ncbi:MAG: SMC-Scp complex subunit ScpB [Solirubrobacterales bacterium]